jgi:hypothetical protein
VSIDRLDYHWAAAEDAGQPGDQGFVHIACFLAWALAHDLHVTRVWSPAFVARAVGGAATLREYIDESDAKLFDAELIPEGRRFVAHSYDAYLSAYDAAFPDVADYAIPFDAATRAITAAILDELYATWVAAGRPDPGPRDETEELTGDEMAELDAQVEQAMERLIVIPEGATDDEIEALLDGIEGSYSTVTLPPGWTEHDLERLSETPRERPDLEARLPPTIGGDPPILRSEAGADPPLQRDVDLVETAAADAGVDLAGLGTATGDDSDDDDMTGITIWSLPGRSPDTLAGLLRTSLRTDGRALRWVEGADAGIRTWTAEIREPLRAIWVAMVLPDVVVTVLATDPARLDEAIGWFRDHPGPARVDPTSAG